MSGTQASRVVERTWTDHRFVAEAMTETGAILRGESKWEPSQWDADPLRRFAIADCRAGFKQADLLRVKVGPIRVYREVRRGERVTTEYVTRRFDSEVTR